MRGPFEFLGDAAYRQEQFRQSIEAIGDAGLTRLANDIFPPKDPLAKYERTVVRRS